ncbi:MAG: hypothetical protein PVH84_17065 [Candidatus Aminicenantes bacterium]|jgi:hypothetical protein
MAEPTQISNLIGAIVANLINVLLIAVFIARLNHRPKIEYWLGIAVISTIVPLVYMFITAIGFKRPFLYFIQIGLMIGYLVVEFLLDYVFRVDFRQNRGIVIPYITLLFAGTGGMIGVASHAGKVWTVATVISFLIMAIVAFIQRTITGQ